MASQPPSCPRASSVSPPAALPIFPLGRLAPFPALACLPSTAPVALVSTYASVTPVVAVRLGPAFVGEHLGPTTLVGGAITVAAVALVITEESRRPARSAAGEDRRGTGLNSRHTVSR